LKRKFKKIEKLNKIELLGKEKLSNFNKSVLDDRNILDNKKGLWVNFFKPLSFSLLLGLFPCNNIFAGEDSDLLWGNSFGGTGIDYFHSVVETSDKGFAVAGGFSATVEGYINVGGWDALVAKYDSNGKQQWVKTVGGLGYEKFLSIAQTQDDELIVVGYTSSSTIENLTTYGSYDALIAKYSSNGDRIWIKNFGGLYDDYFIEVKITANNEIIVVGECMSGVEGLGNNGGYDALIVKFDIDGNQIWTRSFGGSSFDYYKSLTETNDGGIVAVGYTLSSEVENLTSYGSKDAIIAKYDKDGNQIWAKNFGGSGEDYFFSVTETYDNGLVAVGYTKSNDLNGISSISAPNYLEGIIVKFNKNGNQLWAKNFGGSGDDYLKGIIETKNGDLVIAGYSNSSDISGLTYIGRDDGLIIGVDNKGNQKWIKNFGCSENDSLGAIIETSDKDLVVVGYSNATGISNISNKGSYDGVIVRYKNESDEDNAVKLAQSNPTLSNINNARVLINAMEESIGRDQLQLALDNLIPSNLSLIPINSTSNFDVYVASNSSISLTLLNTSITFEGFDGITDLTVEPLTIKVSSSLNYNIKASLVGNIVSSSGNILDKSVFNIKANSDATYKNFSSSSILTLFTNQSTGNNQEHKISMMLKGNIAHTADVYKAVLKLEVEQI
jgi:hypothetical protein